MPDYPTDDDLATIRTWPVNPNAPDHGYRDLFEFIHELWWPSDQGPSPYFRALPGGRYEISTVGWSGNEDIIRAMMDNHVFWTLCWYSHRRGGHYTFELPVDR